MTPVLSLFFAAGCAGARLAPITAARPVTSADSARARALAAEQVGTSRARRGVIGVLPFASLGSDSTLVPLAYALADLVATDLSRSKGLTVVERARLGEVLRELDLAESGRVDSATAPRVGRLVSAERLIFGSVEPLPDGRTIRLGARIGDVERSTVTSIVDARAPLAEIFEAEKELVFRLFQSLGIVLSPAERAEIEQRPTKSVSALLAYGRGVQRTYQGDSRGAAEAFREAHRIDKTFEGARTREIEAKEMGAVGTTNPIAIPGVRSLDRATSMAVDRINRPLDLVTNVTRAVSTPTDPSFPITQGIIVITVVRP
ncbi:CsgG/HfaB family protein [Gemmatimonas sp.]|uniref:CsgG/HfaB family protein n=1 Tax=Gemmatimonas sp. TaxID=1962908 RepID=UPI0035695F50